MGTDDGGRPERGTSTPHFDAEATRADADFGRPTLTPRRMAEIRARLEAGFYTSQHVARYVARALLNRPDLWRRMGGDA